MAMVRAVCHSGLVSAAAGVARPLLVEPDTPNLLLGRMAGETERRGLLGLR